MVQYVGFDLRHHRIPLPCLEDLAFSCRRRHLAGSVWLFSWQTPLALHLGDGIAWLAKILHVRLSSQVYCFEFLQFTHMLSSISLCMQAIAIGVMHVPGIALVVRFSIVLLSMVIVNAAACRLFRDLKLCLPRCFGPRSTIGSYDISSLVFAMTAEDV